MTQSRGRDALFGEPQPASVPHAAGDGRRAVFSAPPRRRGTIVIECARCQARSPVALATLGLRLIPSVWIPGRSFSRLMRCPDCRQITWCRVHWRSVLP